MNAVPDQAERTFERIVGNSSALESVLDQVEQVTPTNPTVLIEGETVRGMQTVLSRSRPIPEEGTSVPRAAREDAWI